MPALVPSRLSGTPVACGTNGGDGKRRERALPRAEFEAGVPCRGCGEPWLDGLGGWPPLLKMTPEQRADHDREEERYRTRHGKCRAHRETVEGNRTWHCGYCCCPPPLPSAAQEERLRQLVGSWSAPNRANLMVWELTHTCGHAVRRTSDTAPGSQGVESLFHL